MREHPRGLKPAARRGVAARGGFTLLELMLVLGMLALLAIFVVPNLRSPIERSYLPESGERLRALITLTRANAMLDGLRYRIRFLDESEGWKNGRLTFAALIPDDKHRAVAPTAQRLDWGIAGLLDRTGCIRPYAIEKRKMPMPQRS